MLNLPGLLSREILINPRSTSMTVALTETVMADVLLGRRSIERLMAASMNNKNILTPDWSVYHECMRNKCTCNRDAACIVIVPTVMQLINT